MQGNKSKAIHLYNLAKKRALEIHAPKKFINEVEQRLMK